MFPTFSRLIFETLRSARNMFLSGLLVVVPLGITILIFFSLFNFFDGWFRTLKRTWLNNPPQWFIHYLPAGSKDVIDIFIGGLPPFGVGFILTIVLIFLIGFTTRLYFGKKIVSVLEWFFQQIPGFSVIYNGLKQVVEQLIGRGNKLFDRVVLIEYPRKGIYSIAFVTGRAEYFEKYTSTELHYVFIATSPNPTSGVFIMIPKDDMIDLDISVEEAMKMVISSGMVAPQAVIDTVHKKRESEQFMFIRFIVLLLFTFITFQNSYSDKVWLQNGDIISGRVVSLEGGTLFLNSTIMNEIQIPWSSVQSIHTEKAVSVILKNGDRITAILSKNTSSPIILKSELLPEVPLSKERIHAIGVESNIKLQNDLEAAKTKIDNISNELHDSNIQIEELQTSLASATEISQLWSGSVSLLGGFKTGNRESKDLFVTAEAIRETDDEKLTLRSDFGYGESEKVVDTTEGRVQSNIQVYFSEDYYVFGDLLLEHDRFEDLELRVDGTVGVGYRLWKTKESSLSMDIGVGGSQEIFRSGGSKTEGITRFSAEFSQILYGKTKLKQSLTVFPSVSELGDLRLISRTSLITPILNSLSWDLSIIDEFNTSPRNATIKKNDVAVRTGLTYSF